MTVQPATDDAQALPVAVPLRAPVPAQHVPAQAAEPWEALVPPGVPDRGRHRRPGRARPAQTGHREDPSAAPPAASWRRPAHGPAPSSDDDHRQWRMPGPVTTLGSGRSRAWNGYERRGDHRVRRLAREFDSLCAGAVDAAEITAGLESAGFTDGTAREYGYQDVFTLAETLYRLVPRGGGGRSGRLANPWGERPLKHLTRGVTFALPGLLFVACLPAAGTATDVVSLVVAMLLGWPAGQTLAFLGYVLDGRWHPAAARAVLAVGLVACLFLAAGYVTVVLRLGAGVPYAVLGGGEIVYLAASTVLLVTGHERTVLAILLPGVVCALLSWQGMLPSGSLSWRGTTLSVPLLALGAGVTLAATLVAAVAVTSRARPRDLRTARASLSGHDRGEALLHLVYGMAGGILVSLPLLVLGPKGSGSLSLVPVIWSMGWAEWFIVSLRRRCFELLADSYTVGFFRLAVRGLARHSVLRYLAVLTLLTVVVALGQRAVAGTFPDRTAVIGLAASWILGWGFYLALMLSSLGRMRTVVFCMVVATAAGAAVLCETQAVPAIGVGPAVLCLLLLVPVHRAVDDPTCHV